jgi:cation-transporting ATPase E
LKIISGDTPATVAALAKQAGLAKDIILVSGTELAKMNPVEISQWVEKATIFGRITPQQKEMIVRTLRARGHYVAMIGDGVNDVLSLKQANLGIAMQSGSQATRSVADIVLLNDSFAALPFAVREGQRILNGMQDIFKLFLTRVLVVALLVLSIEVVGGFPFSPRHSSLLSLLTVGVPTLALAAWARPGVVKRRNLVRWLLRFVLPPTIGMSVIGMGVFLITITLRLHSGQTADTSLEIGVGDGLLAAQTALTSFTILCGLLLIPFVEPPTKFWVGGDRLSGDWRPTILAIGLMVVYIVIMAVPFFREMFDMLPLTWLEYLLIVAGTIIWAITLRWSWRTRVLDRFFQVNLDSGPAPQKK